MRRSLAIAAGLAALLCVRASAAFCRSAACPPHGPDAATQGQRCTPTAAGDCGTPIQWRQPCISFSVQQGASRQVDYTTADATITRAFAAWTAVDCGGGKPSIQILDFSPASCSVVEYNQHEGNANLLVFRDDEWPHDTGGGGVDTLALTTVTYDVDTGDIYDADNEVNTALNTFSTSDSPLPDDDDLLSVLTHETGHFLGLAHTMVYPATMFASYAPGTTSIRTLSLGRRGGDLRGLSGRPEGHRRVHRHPAARLRARVRCAADVRALRRRARRGWGAMRGASAVGLAIGAAALAARARRRRVLRGRSARRAW